VYQAAFYDVADPQAGGYRYRDHRDELGCVTATMEPPSTTPVAGSEMILTNPLGSPLINALAAAAYGTLVTRIFRPLANASASAKPTSAISGSVKMADAAFS